MNFILQALPVLYGSTLKIIVVCLLFPFVSESVNLLICENSDDNDVSNNSQYTNYVLHRSPCVMAAGICKF